MQSKSNLIPIKKGQLSKEEAMARGSNGGKASVIARKENKLFKEIMQDVLNEEVKYGDRMITKKMAWVYKIVTNSLNRVNNGKLDAIDIKAFEMVRDTLGEDALEVGDKLEKLLNALNAKANEKLNIPEEQEKTETVEIGETDKTNE